jgi:hypothetical protein
MGPLALAVIALIGWMWWTGRLKRLTGRDAMAIAMGILGVALVLRGKPLLGAAPAVLTGLYALWRFNKGAAATHIPPPAPPAMNIVEARALLGVDESADADAIRAAHRRLIALIHPDRGGTEELARKINAARDALLRHHGEK